MSPNLNFMDLPLEIRIMCIENLFEAWSLRIKKTTENSQISMKLLDPPKRLALMYVSKDFQENTKLALLKKFDKKLELCFGSHTFFIRFRQNQNMSWITDRIEHLTLHVRGSIPTIDYHFKFPSLQKITLISAMASAPRHHRPQTVLDVLVNRTMDTQVLNAAATLSRKIKGNYKPLRRIIQERTLEINRVWYCKTLHGTFFFPYQGDYVIIATDLMAANPVITGIRAELNGGWVIATDANGNEYMANHFLRGV